MAKNYHYCATCEHFRVVRDRRGFALFCSRLGYATKSEYQFNCWLPRADIAAKMEEEPALRR